MSSIRYIYKYFPGKLENKKKWKNPSTLQSTVSGKDFRIETTKKSDGKRN